MIKCVLLSLYLRLEGLIYIDGVFKSPINGFFYGVSLDRKYSFYKVHNGKIELLESNLDRDSATFKYRILLNEGKEL